MDYFTQMPGMMIPIAAFLCGAALLYLVMRRTAEKRDADQGQD